MDDLFNQDKNKTPLVNLQIYIPELQLSYSQNDFLESSTINL